MFDFAPRVNAHGTTVVLTEDGAESVVVLAEGVNPAKYLRQMREWEVAYGRNLSLNRAFLAMSMMGSVVLVIGFLWAMVGFFRGGVLDWVSGGPMPEGWPVCLAVGLAMTVVGVLASIRSSNRYDATLMMGMVRENSSVVAQTDSWNARVVADLVTSEVRDRLAGVSRGEGVDVASSVLKAWAEDLETDRRLERYAASEREADRLVRLRAEVVGE